MSDRSKIIPEPSVVADLGTKTEAKPLRKDLLAVFDSDADRAEEKCLGLYQKLVRYFEWNRKSDPEDLAQETLRRGFSRLQEGQKITTDDPAAYFFGIARNLVREGWRAPQEEPFESHEIEPVLRSFHNLNQSEQLIFLKQCLRGLENDDFEALLAYMNGEGEAWARKNGLTPVALRSRVCRIRQRLEKLAMMKSGVKSRKSARHREPD